jgi:hypothetical protein
MPDGVEMTISNASDTDHNGQFEPGHGLPHVLAALDSADERLHSGGPCSLDGEWFVVELRYLFR